jgi:DNA-binding NarL/FixJ family response regulator
MADGTVRIGTGARLPPRAAHRHRAVSVGAGRAVDVDVHIGVVGAGSIFGEALQRALALAGLGCVCYYPSWDSVPADPLLDVGITHVSATSRSGLATLTLLRRRSVSLIALLDTSDTICVAECLDSGADYIFDTGQPLAELMAMTSDASKRLNPFSAARRADLLDALNQHRVERDAQLAPFTRLTGHEREVLAHLIAGDAPGDIAGKRVVSITTVRSQIRAILQKLDVRSQLAAVALAQQVGWTGEDEVIDLRTAPAPHLGSSISRLAR